MTIQPLEQIEPAKIDCTKCPPELAIACELSGFARATNSHDQQAKDCPANAACSSILSRILPSLLLIPLGLVVAAPFAAGFSQNVFAIQSFAGAIALIFALVWFMVRDHHYTKRADEKRLVALARIDALAEAERRSRVAKDIADAAAATKTVLIANMSHEIRTPMNGVIGFAQLLLSTKLSREQRGYAELILESGDSMVALLNDILDIAKIEAGKMDVAPECTNVRDLVTSSTSMMKAAARQKGLKLAVSISEGIPRELMLDGLRVRQVLSNLIGNAIKFTDEGEVRVALRLVENGSQQLLEFAISDTGIGIADEWQSVIFDEFVQGDGSNRRAYGGSGLGLPISRKIAQLMQGTLTLESHVGRGTHVLFRVPLTRPPKPGQAGASKPPELITDKPAAERFARREGTVLVAEDCDVNQILMREMLAGLGFNPIIAETGSEAVDKVSQAQAAGAPIDLVLMDMQMPQVDGLEATRRLRSAGYDAKQLPIIALTANAFQTDIEACFDAGMQEHLAKPVAQRALIEALDRWLVQPD